MKIILVSLFTLLSLTFYSQITSVPQAGMNEPNMIDICPCDTIVFSLENDLQDVIVNYWYLDDELVYEGLNPTNALSFCFSGQFNLEVVLLHTDSSSITENATIRVSTLPNFSELLATEYGTCDGQTLDLLGGFVDTANYSGFTMTANTIPSISIEESGVNLPIPDNDGICFEMTTTISGYNPNAVISSPDEISNLFINIDHTYMADLIITYFCPNGSSITTHQQGGGSTNIGEIGVGGLDYYWSADTIHNTWDEAANGVADLPGGTYESLESFENFVGCPLNGEWGITICDVWSNDQGTIYDWGINLNFNNTDSVFSPEVVNAYWEPSSWIIAENDLSITVLQEEPQYEYTFVVENNFGCSFSQDVEVNISEPVDLDLLDQMTMACSDQEIIIEASTDSLCSIDSGSYSYCYADNENITWTYCPDEVGNGAMMTMQFEGGYLENNYDYIYFYDGMDSSAPFLGDHDQDLTNISYTATNASGCITAILVTDGSVNCGSNGYTPISYTVSCGDVNNYSWSWEPAEFLNDSNIPSPQITDVYNDIMIFTATISDPNNPECYITHEVQVNAETLNNVGEDAETSICSNDQNTSLFDILNGTPSGEGIWLNSDNEPVSGIFSPEFSGIYEFHYTFNNCNSYSTIIINVTDAPTIPTILNDNLFLITDINEGYQWYLNGSTLVGSTNQSLTAPIDGSYTVEVFNENGCSSFSEAIIIGDGNNITEIEQIIFSIVPNPLSSLTTLTFENVYNVYEVTLYTMEGRTVQAYKNVVGKLKIEKGILANGLYTLQVRSAQSGRIINKKLIVQ